MEKTTLLNQDQVYKAEVEKQAAIAAELAKTPSTDRQVKNLRLGAKGFIQMVEEIKEIAALEGVTIEEAIKIGLAGGGQILDLAKWRGINARWFTTMDALRLYWDGDGNKKGDKVFPGQDINGNYRAVIQEHSLPFNVTRDMLIAKMVKKDMTISEVVYFLQSHTIIATITAEEDKRIESEGFMASIPDPSNIFSRYSAVGLEIFPLKIWEGDKEANAYLPASAKKAQKKGLTFEEWVETIIEIL